MKENNNNKQQQQQQQQQQQYPDLSRDEGRGTVVFTL